MLITYPRSSIPLVAFSATQGIISALFSQGQQGFLFVPQPTVDGVQVLFQDAAGTTPVVDDGDPVGLMLDLSPNGNHATQSVSTDRPIYHTDGTLHWIGFNGVNHSLSSTSFPSLGGGARFLSVGGEPLSFDDLSFEDSYATLGAKAGSQSMFQLTPHGTVHFVNGAALSPAIPHSIGQPGVMTGVYDGSELSRVRTDGVVGAENTSTPPLNTLGGIVLGAVDDDDDGEVDHGAINLFGVVASNEYSVSKIEKVESYLAGLSGSTL